LNFSEFLKSHKSEFTWLLKAPLSIDNGYKVLLKPGISGISDLQEFIQAGRARSGKKFAFGGYLEDREVYRNASLFGSDESRTIHLGLDIWIEARTPIYIPFDGRIHSFQNNNNNGDYGPTIISEHNLYGHTFFLLFGHLSHDSLLNLQIGKIIKKGEKIADLGTFEENGGWPPHLHFQIIRDMEGCVGDYPGVAKKSELNHYQNNCPDPMIIFN
jgi:murein DD-endopeptidase MepM/ murein hydrolase activator NlpD